MTPKQEYSSVTEYLQTGAVLGTGATITTDANGDTVLTARIRLCDDPNEDIVDVSALDLQEIERLRDADPFMYRSIVCEQRRSSLYELDEDEDDDDDGHGGLNMEFDLRAVEQLRQDTLRRSIQGMRQSSFRHSNDDEAGLSVNDSESSFDPSDHDHSRGSAADINSHSGGAIRLRPTLEGRRSSLYNLNEEDETNPDPADSNRRVSSAHRNRELSSSFQQRRVSTTGTGAPRRLSMTSAPRRLSMTGVPLRRGSMLSRGDSFTSTGSSVVARRRRFSTEAHSSLIMANLEATLMGSTLTDSPDLDSLFDGDDSESDDDAADFLRLLREES